MNANELADELEIYNGLFVKPSEIVKDSIAMLRQQQAEILAGKIMIKGFSKTINELQAENEALKVKTHEWYLIAMGKAQEK